MNSKERKNVFMEKKIQRFFPKNHIEPTEIKYIKREEGKTCIYLIDGRIVETYTPLKAIVDELPVDEFLSINKGIVAATCRIVNIKDDLYTMRDGSIFKGRARMPRLLKYEHEKKFNTSKKSQELEIDAQCAIFDDCPLPFALVGIEYDHDGHELDYIVHYANDACLRLFDKQEENVLNQSLYLFNIEKKTLVLIADVALNGGQRVFQFLSVPRAIQCYQPEDGFCALLMMPE